MADHTLADIQFADLDEDHDGLLPQDMVARFMRRSGMADSTLSQVRLPFHIVFFFFCLTEHMIADLGDGQPEYESDD